MLNTDTYVLCYCGRVYDCVKLRTLTYCAKHGHLRTVLNSLRLLLFSDPVQAMAGRVYDCVKLRTLTYRAKHGHLRTVLNSLRAASIFRSSAGNGMSSLSLFKLRTLTYCAKQLVFELLLFSDPVQAIACRVYDCVKLQTLMY